MRTELNRRTAGGFSLVELMVALTLGLVLISGMITVFAGNQRSSELNSAMTDIQEAARFAIEAIARDARMAGFQGCVNSNSHVLKVKAKTPKFDFGAAAISGSTVQSDTDWLPAHPLGFLPPASHPAIPGTHTLTLQFASHRLSTLSERMTVGGSASPAGDVVVTGSPDFTVDDLAVIADCDDADLFRVTGVSSTGSSVILSHDASGNDSGNLEKSFGAPGSLDQTLVTKFLSNTYYVADTGLDNAQGNSIRALYQQSLPYDPVNNPPIELIQGVDDLRVAFGVRDGTRVRYMRPDASFNPADIESIQLGLLMSSHDPISQQKDNNTYLLAGQAITAAGGASGIDSHAGDRRFRLAFNTTIKVRNRRGR